MKIAIIGQGLNSLVSASILASVGNDVYLKTTNEFEHSSIIEPGLSRLYAEQLSSGRLKVFNNKQKTREAEQMEVVLLAEDNSSDMIENIIEKFRSSIKNNAIFIILSPSFIGESELLESELSQLGSDSKVCCIPLLIREGRAISDFSRPDRIIVGCNDVLVLDKIKSLLYPFNRVKNVMMTVHTREAEFSSFAGNAMLATRLSFMNEMANLAERLNVDIDVVRECVGSDPRIGKDYLYPGCGFGGTALDKNIDKVARELKVSTDDLGLLDIVSKINERQKDLLFRKIWKFFKTDVQGKRIAIWGVSFKPGTASIDRAPAVKLIDSLLAQSALVSVYDPLAGKNLIDQYGDKISVYENAYEALIDADVLAVCTEWKEFWSPDFKRIQDLLKYKTIFDGRNLYSGSQLKAFNLTYFGIGKGQSNQ